MLNSWQVFQWKYAYGIEIATFSIYLASTGRVIWRSLNWKITSIRLACGMFWGTFFIANWCGRGFPSPPKQMFLVCRSKQAKQTRNQLSSVVSASVPAWVAFDFSPMVDCDSEVKSHKPFLASPGCFQSVFCYHDWKQTRVLLNCLRMWLSGWMLDWCVQGSGLWS